MFYCTYCVIVISY